MLLSVELSFLFPLVDPVALVEQVHTYPVAVLARDQNFDFLDFGLEVLAVVV
ncbi:MAG: hypothetical protein NVS9B9_02590 [Ktedonobacteraceae bacterium]